MRGSINQPWGVSDKLALRYGKVWADMDFIMSQTLTTEVFRQNPLDAIVGELHLAKDKVKLTYKDLLFAQKSVTMLANELPHSKRLRRFDKLDVVVNGKPYELTKTEINRLSETLSDTVESVRKSYALGLYL